MLRGLLGLSKSPPDPRRTELMKLIRAAPNVPAPTRALAMLGISQLPGDALDYILGVAQEIEPLLAAGDLEGIRAKLVELDLPPEVMKMAEELLSKGAPGLADPQDGKD